MTNLEKVKKLRIATGAGFKDCNSALKESKGDIEKSIEILRVKGISKASKKMLRIAKEGLVAIYNDENKSSIIEVNCETDFVAKNKEFINFVKEINIINNKISSSLEDLNESVMTNGKKVKENLVNLISKIGEKITIGRSKTIYKNNSYNYFYLHTIVEENLAKLGVIVSISTSKNDEKIKSFGKQLSMHIAALNPLAITSDEIEINLIKKEQELINEELKSSGKSADIIDKISKGKLMKFKEEIV
tara:strand:- start:40 stop:777 length:738 start_codon:yes stop_codon:yes gene_type:complete